MLSHTKIDIDDFKRKHKITQTELADLVGVDRRTVTSWKAKGEMPTKKWEILDKMVRSRIGSREVVDIDIVQQPIEFAFSAEQSTVVLYNRPGPTSIIELNAGSVIVVMPLVDSDDYMAYISAKNKQGMLEELPKYSIVVNKAPFSAHRAFRVRGDGMDNGSKEALCAGDIAVGLEIDKSLWNTRFHIQKFEDYIIVHQDGIVIKRIIGHDVENGVIICHSLNPDKVNYSDYEINLSEVHELYNIVSFERSK